MLTLADKKYLTDNFATKKEFVGLNGDVEGLQKDVTVLKVESTLLQQTVQRLEQGMERTEGKIDKVLNKLDKFVGKVADLEQENKMGAVTLRRHGIQIHELATATGTAISE